MAVMADTPLQTSEIGRRGRKEDSSRQETKHMDGEVT